MNNKAFLCLLFCLIFLTPSIVKADCSYDDMVRLKKIATNVSFTYTYEQTNQNANFTITITNLHPDIYIKDKSKNQVYYYSKPEITNKNYPSGKSVEFEIISNYAGCKGELLLTNYVAIPYYNKYYQDPLCKGIEDYKLCQRWSRVEISYDSFKQEITEYKNSLIKKPDIEEEKKPTEEIIIIIIEFLAKYNIIIFGSMIIIGLGLIFYLVRKDDFDLKVK